MMDIVSLPTDRYIAHLREAVERRLADLLDAPPGAPPVMVEALRYAVLGGGKRLRPILVIASGDAARGRSDPKEGSMTHEALLNAACALEMIHTFSLVHDDLPALDDDTLRRGRPTLHVRYDEATAVLAGDALLNLAYEVMAREEGGDHGTRMRAIASMSRAVGLQGMIAGQVLDMRWTGSSIDGEALHRMHSLKTGALFTACCEIGGILAKAPPEILEALIGYGRQLGLAFQIVDDILDVEGSPSDLGKSAGKDERAGKATFPALWGLEGSRLRARECVDRACAGLGLLGDDARHLTVIARGVLTRKA